jgi:hypothetical protein
MSELELLETFRSHGAARRAWLARDAATGKRRGHGYVEVESRADAERLVMRFNGRLVDGNAFSVAPVGR